MKLTADFLAWARDWLAAPDVWEVHPLLEAHHYWMVIAVDGKNWSLLIFESADAEGTEPDVHSKVRVVPREGKPRTITAGTLLTNRRWWLRPTSQRELCQAWYFGDDFLAADARHWKGRFVSSEVDPDDEISTPTSLSDFEWSDRLRTTATGLLSRTQIFHMDIDDDDYSGVSIDIDANGFAWTSFSSAWTQFNGPVADIDTATSVAVSGALEVSYQASGYQSDFLERGGEISSPLFTPQQMWEVISRVFEVDDFLTAGAASTENKQPSWRIRCVGFDGDLRELAALSASW